MKNLTSIAIASVCTVAVAALSVPASAGIVAQGHDKKPVSNGIFSREVTRVTPTSVPEPGTLTLLALGLGGLGLAPLRRRRKQV